MTYEKPDKERIAAMRKRLEGKLWAVKEIKSENYVGTQEAYAVIEDHARLHERPVLVADKVNRMLGASSRICYRATPARVYGLYDVLHFMFMEGRNYFDENNRDFVLSEDYGAFFKDSFGYDFAENGRSVYFHRNSVDAVAEYLHEYFIEANERKILGDYQFKEVVTSLVDDQFSLKISSLNPLYLDDAERALTKMICYVDHHNFRYTLSDGYFIDTKGRRARATGAKLLDVRKMLDRFDHDHVDSRSPYVRHALCKWLRDYDIKNYSDAIEYIAKNLAERRIRLEKLLKDSMGKVVKEQYLLIDRAEYIQRLIRKEQKFIEDYLKR